MKKRIDILNKLHPKTLLIRPSTVVMDFDNKYDLLNFIKNHNAIEKSIEHTATFYKDLKNPDIDQTQVNMIKNQVMNNLIKRGIITGAVYEGYKYAVDGEIIDHAALASGNPECMKTPIKKYDKWFYELYINMSIPGSVEEEDIKEGAIRLIETIKALEECHIEIKVNVIDYSEYLYNDEEVKDLLVIIPLISHLEHKDYKNLLPFITGSFLRGPLFTIARNSIDNKDNVDSGMGRAKRLEKAVNLWNLDEVELAERILGDLDLLPAR